jgi:hypothetical protein
VDGAHGWSAGGKLGYTRSARGAMKIVVLLLVFLILASLGSALYYLIKDKGTSERTAKALTWRVIFSITVFALLMLGYYFGIIGNKL